MARMFMLLVVLLTGTATSQLPEFAQQYRQRLGGAIDALHDVMADFERDSGAFGLTVDEAIGRLRTGADDFAKARGESIAKTQARLARLVDQRDRLQSAGPFQRIGVLVGGLDPDLAKATAGDYEPAVPVTVEGAASAAAGAGVGFLLARILIGFGRLGRRRRPV